MCLVFVVSIISVVGIVLIQNLSEDQSITLQPQNTWNFSRLDKWTLAAVLNKENITWVSIMLMELYTLMAYWFLYTFSSKMSEFEFYSSNTFIENFVANHSLIITGVNQ